MANLDDPRIERPVGKGKPDWVLSQACDGLGRRRWLLTSARAWAGLVMLTLLIWQLGWVRFKAARVSQANALPGEDIPLLDSFSEPGAAMAILQHHLRTLYLACQPGEGVGSGADGPLPGTPRTRTGADPNDWKPLAPAELEAAGNTGADSARQTLSELRERVRSLYGESLEDLLFLHFENRSWNSFLDTYLELLTLAPTQVNLVLWGRAALAASRICGRTDEVLDAVQHFIRFSKDGKRVARFQAMLGDWAAGRIENLTAYGAPPQGRDSLCLAATPSAEPALAKP